MKLVRYNDEEWSALYVDGKLDEVGDSYLIDDRIAELYGVETYSSDAFMRGGNTREGVAKTLDELREWEQNRDARQQEADRLRAEAEDLLARAKALTSQADKI